MNEDELELAPGLRDLLADDSTWAEPPPDGADALLAAIRALPPREPAPAPEVEAEPEPLPAAAVPLHRRRRRRGSWVLAAAAVVLALVAAAGVVITLSGEEGDEAREVAIGGTDLAPDASATALVEELPSGVAIELDVSGLPPSPPGTYYQGWLKNAAGDLITIGTFHMRGGDDMVELWAGVDLADYPTLTITIQQEGGGQESSGQVVLTGQVGPAG
jgi:Anti-sigma-K factor rskA